MSNPPSQTADAPTHGRPLSSTRRKVLELMEQAGRPVSAREVFDILAKRSAAGSLATVYRAIQELEQRGLLVRAWSDNGREGTFSPKPESTRKAGPRIRCRHCLRSWPFTDAGLAAAIAKAIADVATQGGEAAFTVQIECADCLVDRGQLTPPDRRDHNPHRSGALKPQGPS